MLEYLLLIVPAIVLGVFIGGRSKNAHVDRFRRWQATGKGMLNDHDAANNEIDKYTK